MSIVPDHTPDRGASRAVQASGTAPVVTRDLTTGWTRPQLLARIAAADLAPRTAGRTTQSPAVDLGLLDAGEHVCRPSETVLDLRDRMAPGPVFKEDGTMILNDKGERVD